LLQKIFKTRQELLGRIIAIALFSAVLAVTWDVWWHGAIGRDSLFEPPHILLYSSVIVAISLGAWGWRKVKDPVWKRLALTLLIVPLTAPFDELWHRVFGVEDLTSPLVVWSPPHLALILSVMVSFSMLLPILRKDSNVYTRRVLISLVLGAILSLAMFLAAPLEPTGPWALLGFWGAGFGAFLIVGVLLVAKQWYPKIASPALIIVFFIFVITVGLGEQINPEIDITPHDHSPHWLNVLALLAPALFLYIDRNQSLPVMGSIAGVLWGSILYGFSSLFFEEAFKYSVGSGFIAVFASLIGGFFAGWIIAKIDRKHN